MVKIWRWFFLLGVFGDCISCSTIQPALVDFFPFYRRGISWWFDACGLGIFVTSDIKRICICQKKKKKWELSGRLSENSSKISNRIPTIMLVHLKFCCPWNDCQHPENPNWTYNYIYNQITILFSWYASRAWLLKLYQIKA